MSRPGPSQPRPESDRYSLEVTRVDVNNIRKRSKKGPLYLEIKANDAHSKRVDIGKDRRITSDATLLFSQFTSPSTFELSIKQSRNGNDEHLLGRAEIKEDVETLLQESLPYELKRDVTRTTRSVFGNGRTVVAGTVCFRITLTNAWERAELCVEMAERGVKDIRSMVDKATSTDSVIGTVIQAVDQMKEMVDTVADIHPVINLSWKAISALLSVCSTQIERDGKLVDLVKKIGDTFQFLVEARSLNARTELLKHKIKGLLDETSRCSRFVQGYAKYSFAGRIVHQLDGRSIDDYVALFVELRKDLDSIIVVNVGKGVDNIEMDQILEKLVSPAQMDISRMATRARCLEGTREDYLHAIMSALLPGPNRNAIASGPDTRLVWLTGAAGAGKSTIALTIADRCRDKGSPATYLFFERGKEEYLLAIRAIAYKLAMKYAFLKRHITEAVEKDGDISGASFRTQFGRLILEPIRASTDHVQHPIVIILDALDECGTIPQRKDLVSLLVNDFVHLPSQVRVLVTSRAESDFINYLPPPEGHIAKRPSSPSKCHILRVDLEHTSRRGRDDVGLYISKEITETVGGEPPEGWEWEAVCCKLTEAANGLFIWASTAVKMVEDSYDPIRELSKLLRNTRLIGGGIDNLYETVLEQSRIPWNDDEARSEIARIMGFVLFGMESLPSGDIAAFLGLKEHTVNAMLKPLRSVLFYEAGGPVRLHHASLGDYLTSDRSGGKPWHIDEITQRQLIAERCFTIMETKLRFNICNLESSYIRNEDVSDLANRVEVQIPAHLKYACLHWARHLTDVAHSPGLSAVLTEFSQQCLLFWFEVLSLTNTFGRVATDALTAASDWSEPHDTSIASFLRDARKLASIFAHPIMNSTPHIYVSMIPLMEEDSEVAAHYARRMSSMTRIDRIGDKRPLLCMKVLSGHRDTVGSVAFAANGKHLASACWDDTVKVCDIDSGEEIFALRGRVVCFSPGGDRIAVGSNDGTLSICGATNGQLVFGSLEGHTGSVTSVAWSPDGARIASGSEDENVIIWGEDGKVIFTLKGHKKTVNSVAFSADSTRLASGSWDKTIRIWDVNSGQFAFGPFKTRSSVRSVGFSPSGMHLVSGDFDDDGIKIWEIESRKLIVTLEGHRDVTSVAYFPCGTRIVSGSDNIKVWDAKSGNIVCSLEGHANYVHSVAVSSDGKYIASGSSDKTIRIWDATATTSVARPSVKHSKGVTSVAFSLDGRRIASTSWDRSIIVWDAETGSVALGPLLGHTDGVTSVTFTPDGSRLLSGSFDNTVRMWDADTGKSVMGPLKHDGVYCIDVSPDGRTVASGSIDGTICVWSIATGQLAAGPLGPLQGHSNTNAIFSVAFSPNGKQLASGSGDKTIIIWNTDSWTVMSQLTGHSAHVFSVCFSPDGTRITSGSYDKTIIIWDTESGQIVAGPFQGHTGGVASVTYSLDGRHVMSCSEDNTIRIWNAETGMAVCKLGGHTAWVSSLAPSPDGRRLVSGSSDNTIRVWDVSDILRPSAEDEGRIDTLPSEWVIGTDGWVSGGQDQRDLLLWIPPDLRSTLCRFRGTAVMSCDFSTKLDFTCAAIGTRWVECFDPRPQNTA